ncbi:hypothetical protein EC81_020875 [Bacteroides fragilis]|nr:hypothetical protein EC81_020875 [Bacteroides fragilis]
MNFLFFVIYQAFQKIMRLCRNSFHHRVSQSFFLLIISNLKTPLCYSVSSVVSYDTPSYSH